MRDAALKQPANPTPEEVQANLQERTRAIIAARPDLEHELRRLTPLRPRNRLKAAGFELFRA